MRGFNRVFIAGYLGGDPEFLRSKGGSPYARLQVATQRSWFNGDEAKALEKTDWHRVFVWGRQAQICARHLRKGNALAVEGHLSTYRSPGPRADSEALTSTAIVADRIHFLPRSAEEFLVTAEGAPSPGGSAS